MELSAERFSALVKNSSARKLVFFSSWCSDCKAHLLQADAQSIFIASFDTQERATATLQTFKLTQECYVDSQRLAKAIGINTVPKTYALGH